MDDKVKHFTNSLEDLFIKIQEADNACLELAEELNKKEFSVMTFVGKKGNVIMKDIADYLGSPMSTTTGIVDKIVEKGYLKRIHSEEDRRTINICLSDLGKQNFNTLISLLYQMGDHMLSSITEKESEQLISILSKICRSLESYVPDTTIKV